MDKEKQQYDKMVNTPIKKLVLKLGLAFIPIKISKVIIIQKRNLLKNI